VDLAAVKEKLASVIEEAKANDPKELKAEIARLKALACRPQPAAPAKVLRTEVKEVPVLKAPDREKFLTAVGRMEDVVKILDERARELKAKLEPLGCKVTSSVGLSVRPLPTPSFQRKPVPLPVPRPPSNGEEDPADKPPGAGEMKVLACVAQFEAVTREQVTVNTGFKRSSRDTYLQRLRSRGLIYEEGDNLIRATQAGIDALGDRYQPLPTGRELQEHWLRRLPEGERKIFEILLQAQGQPVPREEISEATGYKRSSRDTYLQRLRSRMLVKDDGRGGVRASEGLFS
jgi:chromosome segregation and condensation protein ScpB